jgi:hypothetical protein
MLHPAALVAAKRLRMISSNRFNKNSRPVMSCGSGSSFVSTGNKEKADQQSMRLGCSGRNRAGNREFSLRPSIRGLTNWST